MRGAVVGMLVTLRNLVLPGVIGAAILYFGYYMVADDQGMHAWNQLRAEEAALSAKLAELEAEHDRLQTSLARLRDDTLDLDYVEELARTKLSFVRSDELLVAVR